MNTKYILKLLIASTIFIVSFAGIKYTGDGYTKNNTNNNRFLQKDSTPPLASFLVISDIHLNSSAYQADAHGDTGDSLWIAAKEEINSLITNKQPRFIIVLGDLPRHDTSTKRDSIKVRENIEQVIKYFKDSAGIPAAIPLVFAAGNNDSWDGDYSALTLPDSIYKIDVYPFINVDSSSISGHACVANDSLVRLGCFSIYPLGSENKLKLIVLNTVIFTKSHSFPYSSDSLQQSVDATTQINWFLQQMEQAAQNDEKVLIAMHVPPGLDGYSLKDMWYDKNIEAIFLKTIEKYQNNITGLLAGHTHMDGIRLLTTENGDVDALLISVPGVAPGHGNNPSVKLIEYNPDNFVLQDFNTYYMNYWNLCMNQTSKNCEPRLTTWSDSFNFRSTFHDNDTFSMLQHFQQMKSENIEDEIERFVNEIYSDYGKKPNSAEVDSSIYVPIPGNR